MTQRNRWGRLERAGQLHNQTQAGRIITLLCSMDAKAHEARDAVEKRLTRVLQQLGEQGISTEQAHQLLAARSAALSQPASAAALRPAAEYAHLRLRSEFVQSSERGQLPLAISIFEGVGRLAPSEAPRMRRLEVQLFGGERPGMNDPRFKQAAGDWAKFEIERLLASLTRGAQQVRCLFPT